MVNINICTQLKHKNTLPKDKIELWSAMFIDIVKLLNILFTIRFNEYANTFPDDKKLA